MQESFFGMDEEVLYILLLFALFVIPKALQRFRIPGAITCVVLGMVAGMGFNAVEHRETIHLLATFGISALFLFAGLEINFGELRQNGRILTQHLGLRLISIAIAAGLITLVGGMEIRIAVLISLALLTPSTGFILDSLSSWGLTATEIQWVKSKAIASELLALAILFFVLQSTTLLRFSVSVLVLAALVLLLPIVFRFFAARIAPFAPKSEFAFLLMIAIICAFATRKMGIYYLIGAFLVGLSAQRYREKMPAISSENMLHAVEAFSSFFVPFYFFNAGLALKTTDFGWMSFLVAFVFLVLVIPFRLGWVAWHRKLVLGESFNRAVRIALPMIPTLVFSMVLAEILHTQFQVSPAIFGGLILFALVNTTLPSLLLRAPLPEFETPHISDDRT